MFLGEVTTFPWFQHVSTLDSGGPWIRHGSAPLIVWAIAWMLRSKEVAFGDGRQKMDPPNSLLLGWWLIMVNNDGYG